MEGEIRYCMSEDGTRIAYSVEGDGPAILECPAVWESFNDTHEETRVYRALTRGRSAIRYDFRGVGLSQRDAPSYTLDRMTADIEAVAQSANLGRFTIWSSTLSTAPAAAYAAQHPDQVAAFILTRVINRGEDAMPRDNLEALVHLIRSNWEMASVALADQGTRGVDPTWGVRGAEVWRRNVDPEAAALMVTDLFDTVDVRETLREVRCRALIVHRSDDAFSFAAAQTAAVAIPEARLLALPGSGPVSLGEGAEAAVKAMIEFLDEDPETRALATAEESVTANAGAFRAVLFTDLVGHTEMMSRLGDQRGREVLREHEGITRDVLKSHGGTEVKTMGDGFMVSFGGVTKAVECGIALQQGFAKREGEPLSIRVGLNAGEPIEEDGDLFGATVILASRIAAKAEGGEILVSDNIRSLCAGKGFLFNDRGQFVAKGFEEPVRVFQVSWHE